jgi:hypothetical protein
LLILRDQSEDLILARDPVHHGLEGERWRNEEANGGNGYGGMASNAESSTCSLRVQIFVVLSSA